MAYKFICDVCGVTGPHDPHREKVTWYEKTGKGDTRLIHNSELCNCCLDAIGDAIMGCLMSRRINRNAQ